MEIGSESPKYKLDTIDWIKIGKGLLVAVIGAIITYLTDLIPSIDWGMWTPFVVSGFSVLVNIVRKWLTDYSK